MEDLILKNVVESVQTKEYVLPILQRDFVWNAQKISLLFDSILRGYSIGLCLFWEINDERRHNYKCYQFQENYVQGDKQEVMNLPLPMHSKYAILDGQQRLTAICLALKGSYTYAQTTKNKLLKHRFYINLLHNDKSEEENIKYEFEFLADNEIYQDEKHYWYLVNDILVNAKWQDGTSATLIYDDIINQKHLDINAAEALEEQKDKVIDKLKLLYECVCKKELVKVFVIPKDFDENEALDIFVRINSEGQQLSRTDFIFSRIVSFWSDARQEIEEFQKETIIKKLSIFDKDLIMRICLATVNKSTVSRLTTNKLTKDIIKDIRENWDKIKNSIKETARLLNFLGYDTKTIVSTNALIPIVCYIYNGGTWEIKQHPTKDLEDIRKYLSIIPIKRVFSGQTIGRLNNILSVMNNEESKNRPFEAILKMKEFTVTEQDIENILLQGKGKDTFSILSLLYEKNYAETNFDQDHMHPWASFIRVKTYKDAGIDSEKMSEWKKMADTLPNLQILESKTNNSKNDTPFEDWVKSEYPNENKRKEYLYGTYLDENTPLSFAAFESFYKIRKEKLKDEICRILNIR